MQVRSIAPLPPSMFPTRSTIAWLCLVALPISNVAGWVHVGCGHDHGGTVVAEKPDASACSCCHHHCDVNEESSGDDTPPPAHDADRCSVCQGFYAFRVAPALPVIAVEGLDDVSLDVPATGASLVVTETVIGGIWARGPPRV